MIPCPPETTLPMIDSVHGNRLDLVHTRSFGLVDDCDIARIEPDAILAAACATDHPNAEARFLVCLFPRPLEAACP
jgi:maleate isomerase